jgi:hypothetical protein
LLRQALLALKSVWKRIRNGDFDAPLLSEAISKTEETIAMLERRFPDSTKMFDLEFQDPR